MTTSFIGMPSKDPAPPAISAGSALSPLKNRDLVLAQLNEHRTQWWDSKLGSVTVNIPKGLPPGTVLSIVAAWDCEGNVVSTRVYDERGKLLLSNTTK
jgi:hypothetical protein